MKRSLCLLCAAVAVAGATKKSEAFEFSDSFYGKATANVGYTLHGYGKEGIGYMIDDVKEAGNSVKRIAHHLTAGVGFNVYYKASETVHPFIGLEVNGKLPLTKDIYKYDVVGDNSSAEGASMSYREYLTINAKLGNKFIADRDFSISMYGLIGMKIANLNYTTFTATKKDGVNEKSLKKTGVGFNTGVGLEALICDRFTIGAEYQYGVVRFKNPILLDGREFSVRTHGFAVKLGVQFL